MRIQLFGNTSLVTSVAAEESKLGLEIIINTRDKGMDFGRRGSSLSFMKSTDFEAPAHECYEIYGHERENNANLDGTIDMCEVVVIAETDEERQMLRNPAYEQSCKDQIVFVMPHEHLHAHKRELAVLRNFPESLDVHP